MYRYDKELPVLSEYDIAIAGAGMAGVAAAISAGREGYNVCLIERLQVVGGIATAGAMNLFYTPYYFCEGLAKELFDRLIAKGAAVEGETVPFDAEVCINEMFAMLNEANVSLMLDTWICDVFRERQTIAGIIVANKSGLGIIKCKRIVDATGDGDICNFAGYRFMKGREEDSKMRPVTLLFTVGGIDCQTFLEYVQNNPSEFSVDPNQYCVNLETGEIRIFGFFSLVEEAKRQGYLYDSCNYFRIESMFVDRKTATINTIRIYDCDGTNNADINRAIVESHNQQSKLMEFMRKFIPGMKDVFLISSGQIVGVRDTRRIIGNLVMTEKDIIDNNHYDDCIGYCHGRQTLGQKGEGHSPDGNEGSSNDYSVREAVAQMVSFEIPYRILVPEKSTNILVAGRNVSCDFLAHKHLRNQPACVTTGTAAGIAAALSIKYDVPVCDVPMKELQQHLGLC